MKRIIYKREYNTEKSRLLKKYTFGNFGEDFGYEETLYETEDGYLFLYFNGGGTSIHPTEKIKRISKSKAAVWLSNH